MATTEPGGPVGYAHSTNPLTGNLDCPNEVTVLQHTSQFITGGARGPGWYDADYASFAALATDVVEGDCGGPGPTVTTTAVSSTSIATSTVSEAPATGVPVPNETFDYVVIGAGAGGIPIADKLSEAGHKVLLIEKGPPSTGRWGGTRGPTWLAGTGLTRFDVPGLCNEIWHDSAGIACRDTDQMAGCILGGGTAINAGLWWKVSGDPEARSTDICTKTAAALCARLGLQLPRRLEVDRRRLGDQPRLLSHPWHHAPISRRPDLPTQRHECHPGGPPLIWLEGH